MKNLLKGENKMISDYVRGLLVNELRILRDSYAFSVQNRNELLKLLEKAQYSIKLAKSRISKIEKDLKNN